MDRVVYRCSLLLWPPTTPPPEAPRDILVHLESKGRTSGLKIILRETSCKNFQSLSGSQGSCLGVVVGTSGLFSAPFA